MRAVKVLFVALLMVSGAWAQAVVQGFSLDQISFNATHAGNVPCSEYGHAAFTVRQVPGQTQFVQVVAQRTGSTLAPAWLVRNIPAVGGITATSTNVDLTQLGVQRGTCIDGSTFNYQVSLTSDPIGTAPSLTAPAAGLIGQRTDNAQGLVRTGAIAGALAGIISTPGFTFTPGPIQMVDRQGMGNIEQGINECGPSGVVNSMRWLQASGSIDLRNETAAEGLAKMKADMIPSGWTGTGVSDTEFIQGKLRYIQRAEHPLDIVVHYQEDASLTGVGASVTVGNATATRDGNGGPPTFDFLMREMRNGQDVELTLSWLNDTGGVTGGHVVALTGAFQMGNLQGVWFSDDTNQGAAGGLRTNHWAPIQNEGGYMRLGGITRNRIEGVVAESPMAQLFLAFIADRQTCVLEAYQIEPLTLPQSSPFTPFGERPVSEVPGGFTPVPGSPFAVNGIFTQSVTGAGGKFVYAVNFGSNDMSGYRIDPTTGRLTEIFSGQATGASPMSVTANPAGRFLYVANSASNNVSAYSIDQTTGRVTPVAGSPFAAGQSPRQVAVSPTGQFLYVANGSSNNVSAYSISATGALTPVAGSPFAAGAGANSVAVDPNGRFAFVVNQTPAQATGTVSAYAINAGTGALTPVAGSPFAAGGRPSAGAVERTGAFLYVANSSTNNVSAFRIDSTTGALAAVAGSPFAAGAGPVSVAVDPQGQFVYVTNSTAGSTSAYSITAATGALTPVAGSPFRSGANPVSVATVRLGAAPPTRVNPLPAITALAPSLAAGGGPAFTLSVFGQNFIVGSVVRWNGSSRPTVFVSETELAAAVTAADIAAAATAQVTVFTPPSGGGSSSAASFRVLAPGTALPTLPAAGTVNGAGFQAGLPLAPGSIAAAFGSNMAAQLQSASSLPLPTTLGGTSVLINGTTPAPLFYVAPGQLGFQIPWDVSTKEKISATLTTATGATVPVTLNLAPFAPGIFSMNSTGSGQGAVLIAGTADLAGVPGAVAGINSRPVRRGQEFISIFATGLGDVTNRPPAGAAASASPLSETIIRPTLTIGGVTARITFSGLAPGFTGLYQVNAEVPAGAPAGNAVELVLTSGRINSNRVTIAVE